ncbi:hypothetical protein [Clostridium perfringens]|uniref:Uncharacterized protein n=1 Tax=Clostridium perfringens TaxID=1502 RepID=A0AAP4ECG7_CLOPF|nr:hypothetical protein [Clostridium perfringens]MDH2334697.1 hypothetical protein [Clostridium perfringens]
MSKILTLGIYKNKIDYEVIGYIESINKFCKFNIKNIFNRKVMVWDIGAVTEVEGFKNLGNNSIEVIGDCILYKYLDKEQLKKFLSDKNIDFIKFIKSKNLRFGVIKPSVIKSIYRQYNKNFIDIIVQGNNKKIEIKDFRWITYWDYIFNKNNEELLNNKQDHYREFLESRDTYFIIHKEETFKKDTLTRFRKDTSRTIIASIFWF